MFVESITGRSFRAAVEQTITATGDARGLIELPRRPVITVTAPDPTTPAAATLAPADDANPYQHIAADLRAAIKCGALSPGQPLPPVAELAARYGVAFGTAHRAIAQLRDGGLIKVSRGKRAVVAAG